jgi:hypothetical protein
MPFPMAERGFYSNTQGQRRPSDLHTYRELPNWDAPFKSRTLNQDSHPLGWRPETVLLGVIDPVVQTGGHAIPYEPSPGADILSGSSQARPRTSLRNRVLH